MVVILIAIVTVVAIGIAVKCFPTKSGRKKVVTMLVDVPTTCYQL